MSGAARLAASHEIVFSQTCLNSTRAHQGAVLAGHSSSLSGTVTGTWLRARDRTALCKQHGGIYPDVPWLLLGCCADRAHTGGRVQFTPTVQHCSLATLIGLCLRVKLMRALPPRFKVRRSCRK